MNDPRYLRGIDHFNRHEFYDAHEIWEELWHEPIGEAKNFVQGLIQFATALHHFEARNLKGARILYDGGVELLTPFVPAFWGLPVKELLASFQRCFEEMLPYSPSELPGRYHPDKEKFPVTLRRDLIPTLTLRADAAPGGDRG